MAILKTPDCKVIVYNLLEREGSNLPYNDKKPIDFDEIDISSDVISVQISKSKSAPSGNFSITMSPKNNWVAEISVGSWICILIDSKPIPQSSIDFLNEDSLKLIGRIDSVRATRQVNQQTGAYETQYSIQGRDWGSALESLIYLSALAGGGGPGSEVSSQNQGMGQAAKTVFDKTISAVYEGVPNTSALTDAFISIWGLQGNAFNVTSSLSEQIANIYMPFSPLIVPTQLFSKMGKTFIEGKLVEILDKKYGVLKAKGEYEESNEARGAFDISKALGTNSLWQLLNNSVTAGGINEVFADLSFDDGTPNFTIYKRVRPFSLKINSQTANQIEKSITSSFFLLPNTKIDTEEITGVDVGCNWSDVINCIRINWNTSMFSFFGDSKATYESNLAVYSIPSYSISGFKPLVLTTSMIPGGKDVEPNNLKYWLPVLQDWYFDTHKMLNGTIVFSGRSGYIAVGNNILFPAAAISSAAFVESAIPNFISSAAPNDAHILAHIETVSHTFSKQSDGSASYMTTIQFIRGVITDSDGGAKLIGGNEEFGVDSNAPQKYSRKNLNTLEG